MTAIEDARAALARFDDPKVDAWGYQECNRQRQQLADAVRALIAEYERLTARTCERCRWNAGFGAREPIGGHDPSCPISAVMAEARTASPTDDEREALYDGAWRAISGRNEPWGGCAEREKVMRVAEFAAGFRRQGPITDAMVEAAKEAWAQAGGMPIRNRDEFLRAALEAARGA